MNITRDRLVDVEMREEFGELSVSFARSADQTIRVEADRFRSAGFGGVGLETGGQLFSDSPPWAECVHFVSASGPGPDAGHFRSRLFPDAWHDLETARSISDLSDGRVREAGHWHTHPDSGGDVPSDSDVIAWLGRLEHDDLSRFIGLIVNYEPRRWSGWVLRRNDRSSAAAYICERATVIR